METSKNFSVLKTPPCLGNLQPELINFTYVSISSDSSEFTCCCGAMLIFLNMAELTEVSVDKYKYCVIFVFYQQL